MTRLWTIGHSTRTAEAFLALLRENGIELLVDVRRFPTSRWPHFQGPKLRAGLAGAGIAYEHLAELGGYRTGGYPAFMTTEEFARGIDRLLSLGAECRTAIMCAEAVFFRCHRRHIADTLVRSDHEVFHILAAGRTRGHVATERLDART